MKVGKSLSQATSVVALASLSAGCFEPAALDPAAPGVVTASYVNGASPGIQVGDMTISNIELLNSARGKSSTDARQPRLVWAFAFRVTLSDHSTWLASCELEGLPLRQRRWDEYTLFDNDKANATLDCQYAPERADAVSYRLHVRAEGSADFLEADRVSGEMLPSNFEDDATVSGVTVTRRGLYIKGSGARWDMVPNSRTAKYSDGASRSSSGADYYAESIAQAQVSPNHVARLAENLEPADARAGNLVIAAAFVMDGDLASHPRLAPRDKGAVVEVALSDSHLCARRAGGGVRCKGKDGAVIDPGVTNATALSVGDDVGCAIVDASGTKRVACWSMSTGDERTQLLAGPTGFAFKNATMIPGTDGATAIAVSRSSGEQHACAVIDGGRVTCWGDDHHWGGDPKLTLPRVLPDVSGATQLVVGSIGCDGVAGRFEDGSIRTLMRPPGDGCDPAHGSPVVSYVHLGAELRDVEKLAVGGGFTCTLSKDKTVACWGDNDQGELGFPTKGAGWNAEQTEPKRVPGLSDVVDVVAGDRFTCALLGGKQAGKVACWGAGSDGQLGDGGTRDRVEPKLVTGLDDAEAIASSLFMTCAIRKTGEVVCWGRHQALPSIYRVPTVIDMGD
ncbi:MAG: hypothetical protein U0271_00075 [Polyangiaceae bacterium]